MARISIPALSHLNTLFPASKSRPQRVPERPEPNRGETSMYRCSPSRGERVRGHLSQEKAEMETRLEAPLAEEPRLSSLFSLSSISTVSRLTEPGATRTPCPRQKRDREGRGKQPAHQRGASTSAVKWPEAEDRGRDSLQSPEVRGNGRGAEDLPHDGPQAASRASWNKACRKESGIPGRRAEKGLHTGRGSESSLAQQSS